MGIALLAGCCMVIQDIFGTLLVIAESKGREWLAGGLDAGMWLVGIITTSHAVATLNGHSGKEKIYVLTMVTGANVFGTVAGVKLGKRFVKEHE